MGRYCVCHPAYQVMATKSTSPDEEVALPVDEDVEAVGAGAATVEEAAIAEEGRTRHVGAAQDEANCSASTVKGNTDNMIHDGRRVVGNVTKERLGEEEEERRM